jgi:N-acetylmuramoyl-L-alanine amidase
MLISNVRLLIGRAAIAWLLASVVLLSAGMAVARPLVSDVQLAAEADGRAVRFIVDEPMDFRLFTLASPLRLVLDMPAIDWRAPQAQLERVARQSAIVQAVRRGNFRGETERIVFDLKKPMKIVQATLQPHGTKFALTIRWQDAAQYQAQRFGDFREVPIPLQRPARALPVKKPLIALDPGHGGVDPGTIGRRGTHEKTVTLAMAKRLEKALLATGRFRVALTRRDDRFLGADADSATPGCQSVCVIAC